LEQVQAGTDEVVVGDEEVVAGIDVVVAVVVVVAQAEKRVQAVSEKHPAGAQDLT
jgi:tRNA-binding EMAP/Myf-like protein